MTIMEMLRSERNGAVVKVDNGDRWLYWDTHFKHWVVRSSKRRRPAFTEIETTDEELAVEELLK